MDKRVDMRIDRTFKKTQECTQNDPKGQSTIMLQINGATRGTITFWATEKH